MEIYGNKLTLPDRLIEWSICKYEFIDQCKDGDVIIHDRLSVLELARLFNDAINGADITNKNILRECQHLADNWLSNYCWCIDNFSRDAESKDFEGSFKHWYIKDIIGENNIKLFYDNINI